MIRDFIDSEYCFAAMSESRLGAIPFFLLCRRKSNIRYIESSVIFCIDNLGNCLLCQLKDFDGYLGDINILLHPLLSDIVGIEASCAKIIIVEQSHLNNRMLNGLSVRHPLMYTEERG